MAVISGTLVVFGTPHVLELRIRSLWTTGPLHIPISEWLSGAPPLAVVAEEHDYEYAGYFG